MRKLLVILVFAFGAVGAVDDANAQFCPGVSPWVFDDVLASDPFCGYITELAVRGVTLGCSIIDGNHRLYCPDTFVNRKAMSAFMVRLADSLFPLTCSAGQVMKWDGDFWVCSDDNTGNTGTVTSVGTGAGIQGGPITTTGTLSLRLNGAGGMTASLGTGANELGIAAGGVVQSMLSAPGGTSGQVLGTNGSALQWTTLPTIPAVLPIASGGTGATDAAGARTNLGLGAVGTWPGTLTNGYIPRATAAGPTLGNSQIQDNGTSLSIGAITPAIPYQLYVYRQQLTVNGDGQSTIFGYRTRDSQNDGTNYSQIGTNRAVGGYNFWGDVYTFGVAGHNYNDYTRTGGVLGAEVSGAYWGSLGYRSSALLNYGVYGSSGYASGAGDPAMGRAALAVPQEGIGGGFFGGMIGSWSSGAVMGHVSSGEMFASYNIGNVYTSGATANVVTMAPGTKGVSTDRAAAYAVTSPELKVYDNGTGAMSGASVFVPFSPLYTGMLGAAPTVTITPVGSPALLYIKSVTTEGFIVGSASGDTTVQFHWIAVGSRVDSATASGLPTAIASKDFDAMMKSAMSTDGNTQRAATAVWWDGSKVRFDAPPAPPVTAKVPPR